MSKQSFINQVKDGAISTQKRYGILASITIAQAILESGWGKSGLTQKANNLFGIKADSSWHGRRINMKTGEYRNGSHVMENWGFRVYGSFAESIEDHAKFLVNNPRYKKAGFFNASTYEGQADALLKAGYATSPSYSSQLKQLIRQNNLTQYDSAKQQTSSSGERYAVVTAGSGLNVRNQPNENATKLGALGHGTKVHVFKVLSNGWVEIFYGDHGGFVFGKHLQFL